MLRCFGSANTQETISLSLSLRLFLNAFADVWNFARSGNPRGVPMWPAVTQSQPHADVAPQSHAPGHIEEDQQGIRVVLLGSLHCMQSMMSYLAQRCMSYDTYCNAIRRVGTQ